MSEIRQIPNPPKTSDDFRALTLIALRGGWDEPEAANLRPINLLADFLKDLRKPEAIALFGGDDPDAYSDLLREVETMQGMLADLDGSVTPDKGA